MEIIPKVLIKKTYNEDGYFLLNRNYIKEQIGLSLLEQYNCDSSLSQIGVVDIDKENKDLIRVNSALMTSIIINDDIQKIKEIINNLKLDKETINANKQHIKEQEKINKQINKQKASIENKEEKLNAVINNFQNVVLPRIVEEPALLDLMSQWVDTAMHRYGFLTKILIQKMYKSVKEYSDSLEVQKKLLEIAITTGYRDFSYIKNAYEKDSPAEKQTIGLVRTDSQRTLTKRSDKITEF